MAVSPRLAISINLFRSIASGRTTKVSQMLYYVMHRRNLIPPNPLKKFLWEISERIDLEVCSGRLQSVKPARGEGVGDSDAVK